MVYGTKDHFRVFRRNIFWVNHWNRLCEMRNVRAYHLASLFLIILLHCAFFFKIEIIIVLMIIMIM